MSTINCKMSFARKIYVGDSQLMVGQENVATFMPIENAPHIVMPKSLTAIARKPFVDNQWAMVMDLQDGTYLRCGTYPPSNFQFARGSYEVGRTYVAGEACLMMNGNNMMGNANAQARTFFTCDRVSYYYDEDLELYQIEDYHDITEITGITPIIYPTPSISGNNNEVVRRAYIYDNEPAVEGFNSNTVHVCCRYSASVVDTGNISRPFQKVQIGNTPTFPTGVTIYHQGWTCKDGVLYNNEPITDNTVFTEILNGTGYSPNFVFRGFDNATSFDNSITLSGGSISNTSAATIAPFNQSTVIPPTIIFNRHRVQNSTIGDYYQPIQFNNSFTGNSDRFFDIQNDCFAWNSDDEDFTGEIGYWIYEDRYVRTTHAPLSTVNPPFTVAEGYRIRWEPQATQPYMTILGEPMKFPHVADIGISFLCKGYRMEPVDPSEWKHFIAELVTMTNFSKSTFPRTFLGLNMRNNGQNRRPTRKG